MSWIQLIKASFKLELIFKYNKVHKDVRPQNFLIFIKEQDLLLRSLY